MPLLFTAFLAAAAVQAAPAPAPAPKPGPVSTSPFQLTGEQVRQCGAIAINHKQHVDELAKRDTALLAEQATMTARQTELQTMATSVNTKKKKEVEAFNVASAAFNAAVPAFRDKLTARNAYAAEIGPLADSYNLQCSHKSMNPADVAALPDDQRALVGAGAKTSTILVPGKAVPATKRRRP